MIDRQDSSVQARVARGRPLRQAGGVTLRCEAQALQIRARFDLQRGDCHRLRGTTLPRTDPFPAVLPTLGMDGLRLAVADG